MADYYDYVLACIPLAMIGGTALLWASGVALGSAVALAGLVAIGLIGHALFVNAPTDAVGSVGEDSSVPTRTTDGGTGAAGPVSAD